MHALAHSLKTTTAEIERRFSALEFNERVAWMEMEQVGPRWERRRHAELLAAIANGACERRGGGMFTAADFIRDPWAPPAEPKKPATKEEERAALEAQIKAMEGAFG